MIKVLYIMIVPRCAALSTRVTYYYYALDSALYFNSERIPLMQRADLDRLITIVV